MFCGGFCLENGVFSANIIAVSQHRQWRGKGCECVCGNDLVKRRDA